MTLEIPKGSIKRGKSKKMMEEIIGQIEGSIADCGTRAGDVIKISSHQISQIEKALKIAKRYLI